jgi:hypothetical protein
MLQPKKKSNNPADSYPALKDKRGKSTIGGGEGKIPSGPKTGRRKPTMGSAKSGKTIKKAMLGDMLKGTGKSMISGLAGKALGGLMGKNGKTVKKAKSGFAALAPPFDKATYADKIAGATKNKAKSGTKMKSGGKMKTCKGGC